METSIDTRVPPPSWINRDFIQSVLKTAERKKITIDSIDVKYANPVGVGYVSLMFRLTVFLRYGDNVETHKKSLIMKTVLESGELKDVAESLDVFKIEGEMLYGVMPQAHEQLALLEGEDFRPLAAKCYQWGRQPQTFIVMEDLKEAGFRLAQATQPLDLKHCAAVLRAYARLHAATAYLLSKQPHYKDAFCRHMFTEEIAQKILRPIGKEFMTAWANEFDKCPGYEEYSKRYRAYAERFMEFSHERMEQIEKQTKLPVLTHGDCWKNNMMFKYVNGEVSEVRLVDFQGSSVTSPAADLQYFLYANASEEVHRHHMDDLLCEYHSTLVGLLRRLGMQREAEDYTLQELRKDMDHCLVVGVYFSAMSSFVVTSEEHGEEFAEAFKDPSKLGEAVVKSLKNPHSLSYMKYVAPIFVKKEII